MPLPPLPDDNTARLWVKYQTGTGPSSQQHEVMWRFDGESATSTDVLTSFEGLLTAYGAANFRSGWRVISARVSPKFAEFSVPVAVPASLLAFVGSNTTAAYNESWEAVQDTYQGRSLTSGRRASFSLYRAAGPAASSFRFGMPGPVQTALSTASGTGALLAIDESAPSWYTYVNQNYNSYWEGDLRQ